MEAHLAPSFWLATCGDDLSPRPALTGDMRADVCIVGAGYTGLWTAYHLSRLEPSLRVAVVEANVAGWGASGRNGGRAPDQPARLGDRNLSRRNNSGVPAVEPAGGFQSPLYDARSDQDADARCRLSRGGLWCGRCRHVRGAVAKTSGGDPVTKAAACRCTENGAADGRFRFPTKSRGDGDFLQNRHCRVLREDRKLATGDAVNAAARLDQAATANEVYIGESRAAPSHGSRAEQAWRGDAKLVVLG